MTCSAAAQTAIQAFFLNLDKHFVVGEQQCWRMLRLLRDETALLRKLIAVEGVAYEDNRAPFCTHRLE